MKRRKTFRVQVIGGGKRHPRLYCSCGPSSARYLTVHMGYKAGPCLQECEIEDPDSLDLGGSTPESLRAQAALLLRAANLIQKRYPKLRAD